MTPSPSPLIVSRPLPVSGNRFRAVYHLLGDEPTARARAEDICIEETIEYPPELVPEGGIRDHVFGRIESFEKIGPSSALSGAESEAPFTLPDSSTVEGRGSGGHQVPRTLRLRKASAVRNTNSAQGATNFPSYRAIISYADEITGDELPQLINVLFGNISMKPGIRLVELDLSGTLLARFKGPRFGIEGVRKLLGVAHRPLLATAIKPMGLSVVELAQMAHQLALGGMDIIKDDHGLGNQAFAPFEERVLRTVEAIVKANAQTGHRTLYLPNVTGPFETMLERIHFAKSAGATGVMLIPGHCGLDFLRRVADDDEIALPIMSHPAFVGSYVLSPDFGVSHRVLHGQLLRLAGADFSVMPNYVGRFASYSREDCVGIAEGCTQPMGTLRPIFPAPGGGIGPDSFADMLDVYGRDVVYLMSSNLHRASSDLTETTARFREMLEKL